MIQVSLFKSVLQYGTPQRGCFNLIRIAQYELADVAGGLADRRFPRHLQGGAKASFLEPNDAAVSKYARGEVRNRRWIREALRASILSLATHQYCCRETNFPVQPEHIRVKVAILEDRDRVRRGLSVI